MNGKVQYPSRVRPWKLPALAVAGALSLAGLLYGGAGRAQSAPGTAAEGAGLEEIVVTATRRSENLNKVPISVTALSQDDMDQRGIKDFQDIARFTPGVAVDNTGTNAISIRGISSSAGAGTTGIYLDDTPVQMRSLGFNPDDSLPKTFDLDRVEVLRGPQGTRFGYGSEGGTVRYRMTPKLTGRAPTCAASCPRPSTAHPAMNWHGPWRRADRRYARRSSQRLVPPDGGWINRVDPQTGEQTESKSNSPIPSTAWPRSAHGLVR
jgi:hypothetical protein